MALSFDTWLFRRYLKPKGKIMAMNERDRPFFSMIKKTYNSGGADFNTPALVHGGRGWSNTRSNAQSISDTSTGNGGFGSWQNKPGRYVGSLQFSDIEIAQSESSDAAFVAFEKSQKARTDAHMAEFGGIFNRLTLGPPGGYLFQISSISSGVLTLTSTDAERVADVERGDQLVASDDDGDSTSDTLVGSGSVGYVIAVNREGSTPTVTVATSDGGSAASPTGWGANDYVYRKGEFGGAYDSGTTGGHVIDSYQSWVTATADTATFKSIDRSLDTRLSGVRQTTAQVATLNIEEALEQMFVIGRSRNGWKGKHVAFVHTTEFVRVSRSLESRRFRGDSVSYSTESRTVNGEKAYASFSYNVIKLMTQSGSIELIDEPHMPTGVAYFIRPEDWEYRCLEQMPTIMRKDSNEILRKTTDDDYELRSTVYASFMLRDTGVISQNGRTALPSAA